jgi:hypothetical protein
MVLQRAAVYNGRLAGLLSAMQGEDAKETEGLDAEYAILCVALACF